MPRCGQEVLGLWWVLTAPPYGSTPALSLLTSALVVGWVLSEVALRAYARSQGAPRTVPRGRDRGSWLLLSCCVVLLLGVTLLDRLHPRLGALPIGLLLLGDLLMAGGILLRLISVGYLGRFFTPRVTVQVGHALVKRGPYRWVRHPTYTGAVVTLLGFPLASGSLLGLLVALLLIAIGFGYRIHVEEEALVAAFGSEYLEYRRTTHRLLPGLY